MTIPGREGEGWDEYRRLVLTNIESLGGAITRLEAKLDGMRQKEISELQVEVAMLKVRASVFGALGGAVVGAVVAKLISGVH